MEDLPHASEFFQLSLLLAACAAINRPDVYPAFTTLPDDEWAWHDATTLDPYPTVINAVRNILSRNHQVLAGLAISDNGVKFVVLPNPSKDSGDLDLSHCAAVPDGVDHWATIKMTENGLGVFDSDQ